MVHIVEVIVGHPLHPTKTYLEGELAFSGLEITSVEQAMQYLRLFHNGLMDEANELIADENHRMKWQPANISQAVQKKLEGMEVSVWFELRLDRILETIITAQLQDKRENPLRKALNREISKAGDEKMEFRCYGSDRVLTVGYNYGRKNSHATEGHNVMGKVLTEVTEKYRRDQLKPVADTFSELGGILGNADLFRTRQKKSVLVITDSQARHLESVGLGGTVVAVGGAKYGDLLNVMKSGRYHLPDYTMIVLYCGTNCELSRDYSYKDRDREFDELKKFLKNMLQNLNREIRRSANMIFFASSFNVRNGASLDRKHMDSVKKQLSELGIAYLTEKITPKCSRKRA